MATPTVAQIIWDALIEAGATPVQAAGIMGNMVQESSLDPEDNAPGNWGLVQWTIPGAGTGIDRSKYITGNIEQDIINQVLLLKSQGGFDAAVGSTPEEVAINFQNSYERPAVPTENQANRTGSATEIYQVFQNNSWGSYTVGQQTPSGPGAAAQPTSETANGTGQPTGLTMANMPGIEAYIQANYPEDAWMLNVDPQVTSILEQAAINGTSSQNVIAEIEGTNWWKTTSAAMRQFEQTQATNPGELSFDVPGSQASQMLGQVQNAAAQAGVTYNEADYKNVALEAIKFGWTTQQIQQRLGMSVYVTNTGQSNAAGVLQQLQAQAGQYLMNPNDPTLQSWAQNIVGGTQTIQQFDAYMKQNASTKWSGMAGQIAQGYTPQQITNNLRTSVAQTLNIDPTQVDFINNPKFGQILDYVPPNTKNGIHQIMTNSQALQYVKSDPSFGYGNTQGAKDDAASLEQAIVQNFGKVG